MKMPNWQEKVIAEMGNPAKVLRTKEFTKQQVQFTGKLSLENSIFLLRLAITGTW